MSLQTVFRWTSRNGFDGLQAFKEPMPTASKHEVLIKVRSVSINYRDVAVATSFYPFPVKDDVIPCSDMAGEICQVGELVHGFSVGDAVLALPNPALLYGFFKDATQGFGAADDGMLREYIALPAHVVIKLPKTPHSFTQWAAFPVTGGTVWNAFYGNTPLKPGETVLILGTGGVSLTALIFAKAAGATTIITSSSDEKLEGVKARFAPDHTINYKRHPNWAAEIQHITGGRGVDHVVEISGTGTIQQSIESVAPGGIISVIGFLAPKGEIPDVVWLALNKACIIRGILGQSKQQLEEAVRYVASRDLQMPVDKTFGFSRDEIIAALRYIESGKHVGKVCITVS